jgi:crossover junction endodeoxyribonuclease RuvC
MTETPPRRVLFRVLGVDPAAAGPTGYGIVESDGKRCRSVHYGALKVADKIRNGCAGSALEAVHNLICGLLREYSPDAMAVEAIFSALNVKTALRLAEVRGVILLAAAQHGITVHSYAPRLIKSSVAGYGNADKQHVQVMVRSLLGMSVLPEPSDAADALAVALCHVQNEQFRSRFALPDVRVARVPKRVPALRDGVRVQSPRVPANRIAVPRVQPV